MTTLPEETPANDSSSPVDHDVAVAGGGAAGLAAAVFTARYGLDTVVFDGGKAAITQCAHIENYLGFPGGIAPDRFLELGRAHATHEGATMVDERVTAVDRHDASGFVVETTDQPVVADRVVIAAAYDAEVLDRLAEELPSPDPFAPTEGGRTNVDGLYVAGWMSDETVHQVGVNAGHGARAGLALARDDMSERYWPAVGDRYVDWVVHDGRYGGDGWDEHVDEWFDDEMLPEEHDLDKTTVDAARTDLKTEFLGRCIDTEERRRRDRDGQRQLLTHLDDDLIREHAETLDQRP
ncbi:FAD-dependent oxidoreductase [Halococcus saccharolyticus]|uniref:Oxidoreductase (Thioredoxin-disulfide reductase-like protein) n=1 Tax=Halococcus saccharolyticus DSM 5350 TaxID=1227455 RepID=M0MFE0_9EURY|nr:FAD-dependent oxidoreductase [Halococcus saccharolyticus]EMA43409.1 oxidoreductase (thioredoxin-disulfide reductase-like protein) [Halococcus saccharolyticus DSM 5350]